MFVVGFATLRGQRIIAKLSGCALMAGENVGMSSPRPNFTTQSPKLPEGTVVASFATYETARAAVDTLARHEGFTLQQISIIGSDLKSVERVIGRMNAARAALSGAITGTMMGVFVALMWLLVYPQADLRSILGVFLLAIAFGTIWSLLAYSMSPRKREFTSMMQVTASRFDLLVPNELAAEAARVLGVSGGQPMSGQAANGQDPVSTHLPGVDASDQPGESASGAPASESPTSSVAAGERPRTYGEMQDELRRQQQAQSRADQEQ